jgi:hypothetical protein
MQYLNEGFENHVLEDTTFSYSALESSPQELDVLFMETQLRSVLSVDMVDLKGNRAQNITPNSSPNRDKRKDKEQSV